MRDPRSADVVVVGGGALGCACGLALAESGLRVTLIERDAIASHASGNAYGGLYATFGPGIPGPSALVARHAVERHRALDPEIEAETGIAIGFREAPSIDLALTGSEMDALFENARWWAAEGFDFQVLDSRALLDIEQTVTPNNIGGVLHRSHYEVDSYLFTVALATALERRAGTIKTGAVAGLVRDGDRVSGVKLANGETVSAGTVVVATGPWAGLGQIEGMPDLPIRPVKGEILRLRHPGEAFAHRVARGGAYVARKPDGRVWIGTTNEDAGYDERASASGRDSILRGALEIAPGLADAEVVEHTACLRPTSADGLPTVGEVAQGAVVVNGAGSKGILLSHVLAEFVRETVTGEAAGIAMPGEYGVGRYLHAR